MKISWFFALMLALVAMSCAPKIGDKCTENGGECGSELSCVFDCFDASSDTFTCQEVCEEDADCAEYDDYICVEQACGGPDLCTPDPHL